MPGKYQQLKTDLDALATEADTKAHQGSTLPEAQVAYEWARDQMRVLVERVYEVTSPEP